jgi:hypothetical protein
MEKKRCMLSRDSLVARGAGLGPARRCPIISRRVTLIKLDFA